VFGLFSDAESGSDQSRNTSSPILTKLAHGVLSASKSVSDTIDSTFAEQMKLIASDLSIPLGRSLSSFRLDNFS
jgi:hypothetical protein